MIMDEASKIYYTTHGTVVWNHNIKRCVIDFLGIKNQFSS